MLFMGLRSLYIFNDFSARMNVRVYGRQILTSEVHSREGLTHKLLRL